MNPDVEWSTREKLAIASYVFHSGDQHWTGKVSRLLRPLGEPDRPPDWFSPKNCAQQYTALTEAAEGSRRTRPERSDLQDSINGASSTLQVPTPSISEIVLRKVTQERIDELKKLIRNERAKYKKILQTIEQLESGDLNDTIDEMYLEVKQKESEEKQNQNISTISTEASDFMDIDAKVEDFTNSASLEPDLSDSKKKENVIKGTTDTEKEEKKLPEESATDVHEEKLSENVTGTLREEPMQTTPAEELVNSKTSSQSLSPVLEKEDNVSPVTSSRTLPTPTPVIDSDSEDEISMSAKVSNPTEIELNEPMETNAPIAAVTETKDLENADTSNTEEVKTSRQTESELVSNPVPDRIVFDPEEQSSVHPSSTNEETDDESKSSEGRNIFEQFEKASQRVIIDSTEEKESEKSTKLVTEENASDVFTSSDTSAIASTDAPDLDAGKEIAGESTDDKADLPQTDDARDSSINIEPSPTMPEDKPTPAAVDHLDSTIPDEESVLSEEEAKGDDREKKLVEEEESKVEDESIDYGSSVSSSNAYTESFPSSPALSTTSDADPEATAQLRAWKKSIMILWKQVASHKYASLFLHPVTNEIAPNYSSIVLRPMDLSILKKNVENGLVRTTSEFQRDLMLMFQNALMYNNCEHDVYKMTEEMQKDVMDQVGQFLTTQLMMETTKQVSSKGLRRSTLRKSIAVEKGSESRNKRATDTDSKKKKGGE